MVGWAITVGLACAIVGLLAAAGFVRAFVPVALGLTTTALGTLLPILRDNDMLGGRFGPYVLAAGAVGEFLPVVAIAIFLGANGKFLGLISLCAVGAARARADPGAPAGARPGRADHRGRASMPRRRPPCAGRSRCSCCCWWSRTDFGLDVVLGAFLAGVVLRRWAPGDVDALEGKLDAIGYGFFIPVFFVSSGMGLDLRSIMEAPGRLVVFFVLLLVVRGLPTLLVYRSALSLPQRVELALLTATALPLLVALTRDRSGDRDDAAGERRRPGRRGRALGPRVPRPGSAHRPSADAGPRRRQGPAGGRARATRGLSHGSGVGTLLGSVLDAVSVIRILAGPH